MAKGLTVAGEWPLTGLPAKGKAPTHPVMVVKIDNTDSSAPQLGLGATPDDRRTAASAVCPCVGQEPALLLEAPSNSIATPAATMPKVAVTATLEP